MFGISAIKILTFDGVLTGSNIAVLITGMAVAYAVSMLSIKFLMGFVKNGRYDLLKEALLDEGAWLRILREGGTTTFEGWGKDTKWNTSLFHLTMSYGALFLADIDLDKLI